MSLSNGKGNAQIIAFIQSFIENRRLSRIQELKTISTFCSRLKPFSNLRISILTNDRCAAVALLRFSFLFFLVDRKSDSYRILKGAKDAQRIIF